MASEGESQKSGQPRPHSGCHYMEELLAVPPFAADTAMSILDEQGVGAESVTGDVLGSFVDYDVVQGDRGAAPVGILNVNVDPHTAAEILAHRDQPVPASPIHGVGYQSHGKYMSGEGPTRLSDVTLDGPKLTEPDAWIAVVDSGLVEEGSRPGWMGRGVVRDLSPGPETVNGDEASHGTFVTSLIRMIAPELGVALAAAPPDLDGKLTSQTPGTDVDDPPTTELDVLGAVTRLVSEFSGAPDRVRALNLSLGAPRCGPNDGFLLTLRSALDLWRRHFGANATIFAAGGNGDEPSPVYPAAFDCIRGVGAGIDGDFRQRVWDDDGDPVEAQRRHWIDDVAPGEGLYGAGGLNESDVVEWSGSSFASAIATALFARGGSYSVDGGIVFWHDRPVDYANVNGLRY